MFRMFHIFAAIVLQSSFASGAAPRQMQMNDHHRRPAPAPAPASSAGHRQPPRAQEAKRARLTSSEIRFVQALHYLHYDGEPTLPQGQDELCTVCTAPLNIVNDCATSNEEDDQAGGTITERVTMGIFDDLFDSSTNSSPGAASSFIFPEAPAALQEKDEKSKEGRAQGPEDERHKRAPVCILSCGHVLCRDCAETQRAGERTRGMQCCVCRRSTPASGTAAGEDKALDYHVKFGRLLRRERGAGTSKSTAFATQQATECASPACRCRDDLCPWQECHPSLSLKRLDEILEKFAPEDDSENQLRTALTRRLSWRDPDARARRKRLWDRARRYVRKEKDEFDRMAFYMREMKKWPRLQQRAAQGPPLRIVRGQESDRTSALGRSAPGRAGHPASTQRGVHVAPLVVGLATTSSRRRGRSAPGATTRRAASVSPTAPQRPTGEDYRGQGHLLGPDENENHQHHSLSGRDLPPATPPHGAPDEGASCPSRCAASFRTCMGQVRRYSCACLLTLSHSQSGFGGGGPFSASAFWDANALSEATSILFDDIDQQWRSPSAPGAASGSSTAPAHPEAAPPGPPPAAAEAGGPAGLLQQHQREEPPAASFVAFLQYRAVADLLADIGLRRICEILLKLLTSDANTQAEFWGQTNAKFVFPGSQQPRGNNASLVVGGSEGVRGLTLISRDNDRSQPLHDHVEMLDGRGASGGGRASSSRQRDEQPPGAAPPHPEPGAEGAPPSSTLQHVQNALWSCVRPLSSAFDRVSAACDEFGPCDCCLPCCTPEECDATLCPLIGSVVVAYCDVCCLSVGTGAMCGYSQWLLHAPAAAAHAGILLGNMAEAATVCCCTEALYCAFCRPLCLPTTATDSAAHGTPPPPAHGHPSTGPFRHSAGTRYLLQWSTAGTNMVGVDVLGNDYRAVATWPEVAGASPPPFPFGSAGDGLGPYAYEPMLQVQVQQDHDISMLDHDHVLVDPLPPHQDPQHAGAEDAHIIAGGDYVGGSSGAGYGLPPPGAASTGWWSEGCVNERDCLLEPYQTIFRSVCACATCSWDRCVWCHLCCWDGLARGWEVVRGSGRSGGDVGAGAGEERTTGTHAMASPLSWRHTSRRGRVSSLESAHPRIREIASMLCNDRRPRGKEHCAREGVRDRDQHSFPKDDEDDGENEADSKSNFSFTSDEEDEDGEDLFGLDADDGRRQRFQAEDPGPGRRQQSASPASASEEEEEQNVDLLMGLVSDRAYVTPEELVRAIGYKLLLRNRTAKRRLLVPGPQQQGALHFLRNLQMALRFRAGLGEVRLKGV